MSRNIEYAHFDVDLMGQQKILDLVEAGGAEAYMAWQSLVFAARRAADPEHLERAGVVSVAMARFAIGALGLDPRKMVELMEAHGLLDPLLEPGRWMLHEFVEHQHLREWAARQNRNVKAAQARGEQLRASKGDPRVHPRVTPNPSQPNPIKDQNLPPADAGFDEFWKAYPKHTEKQAARRAWAKAVKIAKPEVIIAAAAEYARVRERDGRPQFTKHPATWLNKGCWDDEQDDGAQPAIREVGTFQ